MKGSRSTPEATFSSFRREWGFIKCSPLFTQAPSSEDLRAEPGLVECGTRKHSLLPSPAAPEIGAERGDLNLSPKSYSGAQRGHSTQLAFPSASDRGSRWARELAQVTAQVIGLIPIAAQSGGSSSYQTVKLVSFLIFGNKKRHCSGKPSSKTAIIKKNLFQFFFLFMFDSSLRLQRIIRD